MIGTKAQSYQFQFTHQQQSDAGGEFQFQMGAQKPATICVTNVSIDGKPYIHIADTSPIRHNHVGFLPKADKFVFVASESIEPLRWTLKNDQGISIDLGRTTPFGLNTASGEHLHRIDLSHYTTEQKGLTITVDDETGFPFDIRGDIYHSLTYDAFSYFYQNRSGVEIQPEFVQRSDLARPAGHAKDVVTCFDKQDAWGNDWLGVISPLMSLAVGMMLATTANTQ